MSDLIVIFSAPSAIEAKIVRSLLDAHGIMAVTSSDLPQSIFPLSVEGLGEVRLAVHADEAEEARRVIDGHRTELRNGEVVPPRGEFESLPPAVGYRLRDRGP